MADDPNTGEITGKTAGGDNDDVAMAFLIAMYWSACAMALEEMNEHVRVSTPRGVAARSSSQRTALTDQSQRLQR